MENIAIYVIIIKEKGIKKGIKMKYLQNRNVTKEDKKKMVTVGSNSKPVTNFTKADFMTPAQVGQKFNISTQEATKLMKNLNFKRAVFALNGHKTPVILTFNSYLYLHPMALEAFQQEVNKKVK